MKTLHIIVSDKVASYLQRDGYIVCGNSDYQVEFTFSSEWDAYTKKTARFIWRGKPVDVEFSGNVCPVPIVANTEELKVGVYVENLSTTTSAVIPCRLSVLCDSKTEAEGTVVVPEGTPVLIEKTIIENGEYPAKNYGADGFSKVKINVPTEIPEGYIKPTGTKTITENGPHDVTQYASVEVNVPTESPQEPVLQAKSVTPTKVAQNVTADNGYDGLSKVSVAAIPASYIIPSGTKEVTTNDTHDVKNYASVRVNVPGEVLPDHTASDFTLHYTSKGSGELGVVYSSTEKVAFEAAPEGAAIDTFQDQNFVPGNIKKDVEIFGVRGTYEGESSSGGEVETCTIVHTSGNVLGIIYSDGTETKEWANEPDGTVLIVACNTPIVFYYPMGDEAPAVTITTEGGATLQATRQCTYGATVYSIPSEYKNTHLTIAW